MLGIEPVDGRDQTDRSRLQRVVDVGGWDAEITHPHRDEPQAQPNEVAARFSAPSVCRAREFLLFLALQRGHREHSTQGELVHDCSVRRLAASRDMTARSCGPAAQSAYVWTISCR